MHRMPTPHTHQILGCGRRRVESVSASAVRVSAEAAGRGHNGPVMPTVGERALITVPLNGMPSTAAASDSTAIGSLPSQLAVIVVGPSSVRALHRRDHCRGCPTSSLQTSAR